MDVGFKFFRLQGTNLHSQWTKMEALKYFSLPGVEETNLHSASSFLLSNSANAKTLLEEWLSACIYERFSLLTDLIDPDIQSPGFIEHRHDQSLLSLILEQRGYLGSPDETFFEPEWLAFGTNYPIWTTRLRSGFQSTSSSLPMKVLRKIERSVTNRLGVFSDEDWSNSTDKT
jgi:hypothetical protein